MGEPEQRMLEDVTWTTIGPTQPSQTGSTADVLGEALASSDDLPHLLSNAATADEPVLLLVNDAHRATRTRDALYAIGALRSQVPNWPRFRAIVATGTHQFDEEARALFETATFVRCGLQIEDITWHDANDQKMQVEVACVSMHRRVAEAMFLLPIGSVEPHYFAGVTGPHKTVTIGCMSQRSIEANHAHAMEDAIGPMRLEGNPVYDEIAGILQRLEAAGKTICAIAQVVLSERVVHAAVGSPLKTVMELLPAVHQLYVRAVSDPVDVLHLKVPSPLGGTLYQADKAVKNNHQPVRDGGGIVLEAACGDGVGPDRFLSLLRRADSHTTARKIIEKEGYCLGDHKAIHLWHLTDRTKRAIRLAVVSPTLRDSRVAAPGINIFGDLPSALDWLGRAVEGPLRRGLVVEDAGMMCITT